jgi:hypothetical protein
MRRVRQGYCLVPSPFDRRRIARVDLTPGAVEAIVFWTRDPRPLLPHLAELEGWGYRFYFQFTLLDYPRSLDPGTPAAARSLATFGELARSLGPERVVWRYDPIVLSPATGPDFHLRTFRRLAGELSGACRQVVVSVLDRYRKAEGRLREAAREGAGPVSPEEEARLLLRLIPGLVAAAGDAGLRIRSCAETRDLASLGVPPGACVDGDLVESLTGRPLRGGKDPGQRKACRCVASRDVGAYDTCPAGCRYCYAVSGFRRARMLQAAHDPDAPALVP